MLAILLSVVLSSFNVSITTAGGKNFVTIDVAYSETLTDSYQATFDVSFSTPVGPETRTYVVITSEGISGNTGFFRIPAGYSITGYEMVSYGPYVE